LSLALGGLAFPSEPPEEPLTVLLWSSPEEVEPGQPWTVSILVDHPHPEEVQTLPPELPPSLVLNRVRITPGISEGGDRRTLVEFQFIPHEGGIFPLASFKVLTPGKSAQTPAATLRVRGNVKPAAPGYAFLLVWDRPPAPVKLGEPLILTLRAVGSGKTPVLPPGFRMETPANAIMETLPPENQDKTAVLRLRLIPLEGPILTVQAQRIPIQDGFREIPALRIPVNPAAGTRTSAVATPPADPPVQPSVQPAVKPAVKPAAAFPEDPGPVSFLIRRTYGKLRGQARDFWDQGRRAEGLALIRHFERDSAAGPFLVPLRQAMEKALDLPPGPDEPWRPWKFLAETLLGGLLLLVFIILIRPSRRSGGWNQRGVTLSRAWGYKVITAFLGILLGLGLWGLETGRISLPRSEKIGAVVRLELETRRVPDPGGAAGSFFREGEPALIRSLADSWVYLESLQGKAGWTPLIGIIPY
jgi:hypothetical protein